MFFINHTDIGDGSAAIIEIEGPLNSNSAPDFDDYVCKLADNNVIYLLIDMKNLGFISSEGIGAALMLQKSINEKNGFVVFFNLNHEITSLFRLLGFDRVFTIASDRADALQILDRHMELFPADLKKGHQAVSEQNVPGSRMDELDESQFEKLDSDSFTILEDELEADYSEESFESFVIECIKCRSLIRIKERGEQLCPYCNAEFTVSSDRKAVFKIREMHS